MPIITACPAQKEAGAILAVQDSPDPVLADDGVLVSVAAAGVNPADLLQVAGAYPFGQRPSEARPPQQMKDVKVSAIEMQAMRDVLLQMPVGSKWEVALPPDKAYGADPRTGFPPNVAVVFEIKLVSAK